MLALFSPGICISSGVFYDLKHPGDVIATTETCIVLELDQISIQQFVAGYKQRVLYERISFLRNIGIYKRLSIANLKKIAQSLSLISISMHSFLFKEQQPLSGVYLIKKG